MVRQKLITMDIHADPYYQENLVISEFTKQGLRDEINHLSRYILGDRHSTCLISYFTFGEERVY